MAKRRLHLLVIDPQNDFCDLPPSYRPSDPLSVERATLAPALPVPGAHRDMLRLASIVTRGLTRLTDITVTLDTHQRLDIAHPGFWAKGDGSAVEPFTVVSASQVRGGAFVPRLPEARGRALAYLEQLEAAGRYAHMVWPIHCEIGTWGHNVHAALQGACRIWEEQTLRNVAYVNKGMNPWTEHFSAVLAEVPDPQDPSTQVNQVLLESLRLADRIFIAGEAGSHCVKSTTEHIVERFGPEPLSRLALIEDCMSPVPGFEQQQSAFLEAMRVKGLRVVKTEDVLKEVLANEAN